MESSLNLCDILPSRELSEPYRRQIETGSFSYGRIYIGSYFCANRFLTLKMQATQKFLKAASAHRVPLSLVVPILTQSHLASGMALMRELLRNDAIGIDEIVVNDLGMMKAVHDLFPVPIVAGRMLNKTYRDIRNREYYNIDALPKCLNEFYLSLYDRYRIQTVEMDNYAANTTIPASFDRFLIGVHTPLCYVTRCNICEFAAISKPIQKKFRAADACKLECMDRYIVYRNREGQEAEHYKIGCGVYYVNEGCHVQASRVRLIYNPYLDEVKNADFSTVK